MKMKVYSIRDAKSEIYGSPFFSKTHGEAERSFRRLANDQQTNVGMFREDYTLFCVGEFDTVSGRLDPLVQPQHVADAVNMKPLDGIKPLEMVNSIQ